MHNAYLNTRHEVKRLVGSAPAPITRSAVTCLASLHMQDARECLRTGTLTREEVIEGNRAMLAWLREAALADTGVVTIREEIKRIAQRLISTDGFED